VKALFIFGCSGLSLFPHPKGAQMIWMYPAVILAATAIAVCLFNLGAMSVWVSVLGFGLKAAALILLVVAMVVIGRYVRRWLDKVRTRRA
jgi:hypothetical protein